MSYIYNSNQSEEEKIKNIFLHALLGAFIGYAVIHPFSMLIYHHFENIGMSVWATLYMSFSYEHLRMAFFYIAFGGILGIVQGIYINRISSLYAKVKALSVTDDLTSLFNRRFFFDKLEEEIERARRYSRGLYLLLIDIDDFKRINDKYGHQKGDQVLRLFAQRLKRSIRLPDMIARYGGEEFVILMPEADAATAKSLAERLRSDIASYPFIDGIEDGHLTVSIGIAGFPQDADNASALLKQADAAMYRAKYNGKNQAHKA